jgi:ketosteroid isomerase-like protein
MNRCHNFPFREVSSRFALPSYAYTFFFRPAEAAMNRSFEVAAIRVDGTLVIGGIGKRGLMDPKATIDDDLKAIKELGQEFFAAVNAGDLNRRMATMDPDVVIMPPGRPAIVGEKEMRRLSQDYAELFDEKCSVFYDEIKTAGHWGFVRATVTGTRTSRSDGGVEKVDLKNLWIVKRQPDGGWRFWRIMFNSSAP